MNRILGIVATVLVPLLARSQDLPMVLDLSGKWRFELGDDMNRAAATYNDGNWTQISVPSPWEDQGYPGYDGYAWYRKHFQVPSDWSDRSLYLELGTVDDVDEVFVNGRMIGFMGAFPPHYMTAYNVRRKYRLPMEFLKPGGDNVVAVRVYDAEFSGGITGGRIGIVEDKDPLKADMPIVRGWRFTTGDDMSWKEPSWNDQSWKEIFVPIYWETQGYPEYDGFGWYRVKFTVPDWIANQTLILLAGKIDDLDETYLNGQRIGRTGTMPTPGRGSIGVSDEYLQLRAYTIPPGLLKQGAENVLAIRVFDGFMHGGLYDGPVGIITRDHYLQWKSRHHDSRGPVERFMDWLFN